MEVIADSQGNRLLVRGGPQVQQLVGELLTRIDVSVSMPANGPALGEHASDQTPRLESYPLNEATRPLIDRWQQRLTGRTDVRFALDERTAQVLLVAPQDIQQQVAQSLPTGSGEDTIRIVPATPQAASNQPGGFVAGGQGIRLQHLTGEQLHARLEKAFSRPLPASWDGTRSWYQFQTEPGHDSATIAIHRDSREVRIQGPPAQVADWKKVVTALDQSPQPGQPVTDLVAADGRNREQVRRAMQVLLASNQLVAQPNQQPADEQPARQFTPRPQLEETGDTSLGSLLGPVEIVYVEGLDVIMIRGRDEDVARVKEIIAEIEAATGDTLPEVYVHTLRNANSLAMAALLQRIYDDVLGPRTGEVHITPLGKPNALLLIGREESIDRAVRLVDQLDQPVEPSTRFQVFPLKHAAVADVKPMVDQLIAGPTAPETDDEALPSLSPRGLVVSDVRTNSLIVSASPRDLAEIDSLIKRVDVGVTESRDQVRVVPLRNTTATEMADVIRAAIQGPDGTAVQGDAAAGTTSTRAAALELLTIDAAADNPLRSGILTGVRITAEVRTNSLVVTAPAESMPLIVALIRQLDIAPDVQAEVKVFTMTNADAQGLVDTLTTLFGDTTDAGTPGGLGGGGNALVPLQLSVDARTNSIIAAGTKQDLEVVEAILFRLDGGDVRERITEVIRLKNATAEPVATTLQAWLESRRTAVEEAQLEVSPFEQIEREVIVVPEIVSNSLVVSATPRYITEIKRIISDLDKQPPMVMIQVLIAEVRLGDADEFGVELGLQDSLLFDRSILQQPPDLISRTTNTQSPGGATVTVQEDIIVNAPLSPGYNFNNSPQGALGNNGSSQSLVNAGKVAAQGLSNFALSRTNSELGFSGLVLSASSSAVSAMLRALQENRRVEVLSRPQIMAMDGRQGSVIVGERVPTITGVTVTDFGQNNSITYQDVGLILNVLPHINPDGLVVMEISATKSETGPLDQGIPVSIVDGQPINAPRINTIEALTTVSAMSGQTIVLSGLLQKGTRDLHRRVPIIADIPLLGDLFRYDSVVEERTELLIILTPRVVRSKYDAEMIKQVESSRMSWVLGDVINMHGPSGLRSRCDEWYASESESVYPTYVPEEGEALPLPEDGEVVPGEGPILDGAAPEQPSALGSNRLQIDDPNVRTTSVTEPRRLPPPQ